MTAPVQKRPRSKSRADTEARLAVLERRGLLPLVETLARRRGLAVDDVMGPRQTRTVARARAEVALVLRRLFDLSYPEIGVVVGRDHSSVMHAIAGLPEGIWVELAAVVAPFGPSADGGPDSGPVSSLRPAPVVLQ